MQKGILNQMPKCIQVLIILALNLTVLLGRDYHLHTRSQGRVDDRLRVVTLIGQQRRRADSLNQLLSILAIMDGTRCNKHSDRHTMRIHGQVYLGIEPPFVRSIS